MSVCVRERERVCVCGERERERERERDREREREREREEEEEKQRERYPEQARDEIEDEQGAHKAKISRHKTAKETLDSILCRCRG